MDIKIIRVKQVGAGFSILVSNGKVERGFTFPVGEGWEETLNGEPKFLTHIRQELERQELASVDLEAKVLNLKKLEGKEFKEKAKLK